ncbi:hypothetical protein Cch01nite_28530 [Cellulomonas chitinilytica]|uniref:GH16 domain-containing protein n=1 Tax=Cellulomonas chitinilytica TaxID=398759 RepID=A0A919P696_9CELL|nr:carbohydrate binding domain-containing protein [Cellulomonas chitinilytica]GIG22129.1 hypothetical protein Cch01nite_28530 [Cellulomonas chitinilytica]
MRATAILAAAGLVTAAVVPLAAISSSAASTSTLADFEGSTAAPASYYVYGSAGYGVQTVPAGDALARAGQSADTNVLSFGADVRAQGSYGGFGENLAAATDWSAFDGLQFWMYGRNTGATFRSELLDGDRAGSTYADGERFDATFVDDRTGWKLVQIPFASYTYASPYQPNPGNGTLDLDKIWGYVFPVDTGADGGSGWKFDDIALYSGGTVTPTVALTAPAVDVAEGGTASLTVRLNVAPTSDVTVDWATADGTATAGSDYTAGSGTLTFAAGETTKTVTVATTQDTATEPNETLTVTLSSPAGATLGLATTTVTIRDDDAAPAAAVWDFVRPVESFTYPGALPAGTDADGNAVGFETFTDPGAAASIALTAPPSPVPGSTSTKALKVSLTAPAYAGVTHKFTNSVANMWTSQDWSRYEGLSFWLYGTNTGTQLFVDILDNRTAGSTTDDAGRYSYGFTDDFTGWHYYDIPFSSFSRKEIGNGAPADGLTLTQVNGWAFGAAPTKGAQTWYLADVAATVPETVVEDYEYPAGALPSGVSTDGVGLGFQTYSGNSGTSAVTTAPVGARPGAAGSSRALSLTLNVPGGSWAGVSHAFQDGSAWAGQDWSGSQGLSFWFLGENSGSNYYVDIVENNPAGATGDHADRFSAQITDDHNGWTFVELPWSAFSWKNIGNGAPNDGLTLEEVHGYAIGAVTTTTSRTVLVDRMALWGNSLKDVPVTVGFDRAEYPVTEGATATARVALSRAAEAPVTVHVTTTTAEPTVTDGDAATPGADFTVASADLTFAPGQTVATFPVTTLQDTKDEVTERVTLTLSGATGAQLDGYMPFAEVVIADDDATSTSLVDDFEQGPGLWTATGGVLTGRTLTAGDADAYPGQADREGVASFAVTGPTATLDRTFAEPQDWTDGAGLSFWYHGTGDGSPVDLVLKDDAAADPGPAGWTNVTYRDDFDGAAGAAADPASWGNETGGHGWGNDEKQYYTDGNANAATDGAGHLAITVKPNTNPAYLCTSDGTPCDYTSGRLTSFGKKEFRYGHVEARVKVPSGEGLWPAFWSLGSDFFDVDWPQTGEIDVMEHVEGDHGATNEAFGTIHGPGYSGGASIGGTTTVPGALSDAFHTFAIDWEPGHITWLLDGDVFFEATPATVPAGKQWVFDHPFFLIMNMAIGGNFGGTIAPDLQVPASMLVDYVEVRQAPDTAERFTTSFVDDVAGWRQVQVPFTAFRRAASQPAGAPDNGLTLGAVHGVSLVLNSRPAGAVGRFAAIVPTAVAGDTVMVDALRTPAVLGAVTPTIATATGTGTTAGAGTPAAAKPAAATPAGAAQRLAATGAALLVPGAVLAGVLVALGTALVLRRRHGLRA